MPGGTPLSRLDDDEVEDPRGTVFDELDRGTYCVDSCVFPWLEDGILDVPCWNPVLWLDDELDTPCGNTFPSLASAIPPPTVAPSANIS